MGNRGREIHVPVLTQEVLYWMSPVPGGVYVDATLGLGGHTEALLTFEPGIAKVIGFEWDGDAAELAAERLASFGSQFVLVQASYAHLQEELDRIGVDRINGLVADLGVSSLHLDRSERGFTFKADAPLDMRMNKDITLTAAKLIAELSEAELADIFYHYGEERQARRIARFVVEAREREPIYTTAQLADVISRAVPVKYHPKKIHVATKVFQALRIAVNREFENITKLISTAPQVLAEDARICMISFHSIEDRIVKQAFAKSDAYQVITKKPVQASQEEITSNPRARSAKMRVATRCH
ncbi:16S rRNA (cytosine(1402)-N(4))-methyltransferase RsmH [Desulfogranum marinum]|uniref:16S rRNA (cytosine(1402)-N(4))-methyltransferase RsmH n=1 Tax=Desulfogranum marinum TaxID=453220 RepID=UPI0029C9620E|nr:16S rRNA (cytosine(1402)-N(4))-methyltransferase RsmH [Desulfogranum marinum]